MMMELLPDVEPPSSRAAISDDSERPAGARNGLDIATSISAVVVPAPAVADKPVSTAAEQNEHPDWRLQAVLTARRIGSQQPDTGLRSFGKIPASPYEPCSPRKSSFVWNPETPKAGLRGGIPYIAIGRSCILGMGFFGCAFGEKATANGHLFDDLYDPDAVRGSVPDPTECSQSLLAPYERRD